MQQKFGKVYGTGLKTPGIFHKLFNKGVLYVIVRQNACASLLPQPPDFIALTMITVEAAAAAATPNSAPRPFLTSGTYWRRDAFSAQLFNTLFFANAKWPVGGWAESEADAARQSKHPRTLNPTATLNSFSF